MFLLCKSTRHTAIGTFRFDVLYEVDETDQKIRKHLLPLLEGENPAFQKLSAQKAKEHKAKAEAFVQDETGPDKDATAADLRGELAKAIAEKKGAEDRATAAENELADLKSTHAATVLDLETAQSNIAELSEKLAEQAKAETASGSE